MRDLDIDLQRDLEKIERDYLYKRIEAWEDFHDKILEIQTNMADKLRDEMEDYAQAVARINDEANQRRAEAEMRYRNNEITAERRFQERLRQLRENFLLSLEDAVRERDARQVIQLTRQYKLQREQMKREEKLRKDEARREYELQLKFLEMERQQKLRYAQIEHEERMREIQRNADKQKDEAVKAREDELKDIASAETRAKEERMIRYGEQLEDLKRHMQDRLEVLAAKLQEEHDITMGYAKAIYDGLYKYYGPGGAMEALYNYFFQMLTNMAGAGVPPAVAGPRGSVPPAPPSNAEGGTYIANRPTTATFGDAGLEMAEFTPLTRAGTNVGRMRGGSLPAGVSIPGKSGGEFKIDLSLSPDLEYRIRQKALDDAANVIFHVQRER